MKYTKFIFDGREKPSYWYLTDENNNKSVEIKNCLNTASISSMDYLLGYMRVGVQSCGTVVESTKEEFDAAFKMVAKRLKTELNIK